MRAGASAPARFLLAHLLSRAAESPLSAEGDWRSSYLAASSSRRFAEFRWTDKPWRSALDAPPAALYVPISATLHRSPALMTRLPATRLHLVLPILTTCAAAGLRARVPVLFSPGVMASVMSVTLLSAFPRRLSRHFLPPYPSLVCSSSCPWERLERRSRNSQGGSGRRKRRL